MKYEWKKQEKELYLPKGEPEVVTVPRQKFFAISGKGNPNEADFAERVGVLYSLAYAVRMMPKSGFTPEGYFEYTVYPLEGVWDGGNVSDKSLFSYTIMIRQPEFVNDEIAEKAIENTKKKKPHEFISEADFTGIEDGLSVQIMHVGNYDSEPVSFAKMNEFIENNGLVRAADNHREIYLSDPGRVELGKLKTVLRYSVKERV